jgi:hypothetical protein
VLPSFGMSRDEFIARLHEQGIDCSVHFIPLHQQPYLRRFVGDGVDPGRFPVAEMVFQQVVSLPLYPALRDDHVDRVCEVIAALGRRDGGLMVTRANGGRGLEALGHPGVSEISTGPGEAGEGPKPPLNGSKGDLA